MSHSKSNCTCRHENMYRYILGTQFTCRHENKYRYILGTQFRFTMIYTGRYCWDNWIQIHPEKFAVSTSIFVSWRMTTTYTWIQQASISLMQAEVNKYKTWTDSISSSCWRAQQINTLPCSLWRQKNSSKELQSYGKIQPSNLWRHIYTSNYSRLNKTPK